MADISKLKLKNNVYNIKDAEARRLISELPQPMVFKGSLGTGGIISELPTPSASIVGNVYKVITDGTYASQEAKIGDLFICNDQMTWVLIPSGDDEGGTVTNIATGTGLTGGPITTSGTISVDFNAVQEPIADLATIRSGATLGSSSIQPGDNISELNNDSGYLVTSDFKTINNNSIVGSGNINIDNAFVATYNTTTYSELEEAYTDDKLIIVYYYGVKNVITKITKEVGSGKFILNSLEAVRKSSTGGRANIFMLSKDNTWSFSSKDLQESLVSGTNIKTINNESLLGSGNIDIQAAGTIDTEMSSTSTNAVQNSVIKNYVDTSVTTKQDTLVSGTNIKTINNESILGSGNITVEGSEWMLTSSDDGNGTVVLSVTSTDFIDADTSRY